VRAVSAGAATTSGRPRRVVMTTEAVAEAAATPAVSAVVTIGLRSVVMIVVMTGPVVRVGTAGRLVLRVVMTGEVTGAVTVAASVVMIVRPSGVMTGVTIGLAARAVTTTGAGVPRAVTAVAAVGRVPPVAGTSAVTATIEADGPAAAATTAAPGGVTTAVTTVIAAASADVTTAGTGTTGAVVAAPVDTGAVTTGTGSPSGGCRFLRRSRARRSTRACGRS
jgi:hypothetical protein